MDSIIRLYSGVPLDVGYQNVHNLSVANFLSQLETYKISEGSNFSYVSDNYTLRYPQAITNIINTNYIAFQNPSYKNKWFFGFVNNVKYISDITTEINFTIDYWSTYFNDLRILRSYVEREIVADDTIGANTVDEDLNTGEMITIDNHIEVIDNEEEFYVGIFTDYTIGADPEQPGEDPTPAGEYTGQISVYNSLFNGHMLLIFRMRSSDPQYFTEDLRNLFVYLLETNIAGKIEDVRDMFIIPFGMISQSSLHEHVKTFQIGDRSVACRYYTTDQSIGADTTAVSFAKKYTFSDYQPKNNKALCYPYNFLFLTNNIGNQNIFRYEDFDGENVSFLIEKALTIGCSIRILPTNYRGILKDYDEQIACGKYPTCGWTADSYINWLTQNAVNLSSQFIGLLTGSASSIGGAVGNGSYLADQSAGISAGIGIVNNAMNLIDKFRRADLMPNIVGGQNNGDVNFASNNNNFKFLMKRCKLENLRIIDDFFSRFGYKINRVKIPDLSSRPYWNYIKIAGDQFAVGEVPQDALSVINNVANKGVTIWHNIANIGNYSLDNRIV